MFTSCFLFSPILCLLTASAPHVGQLLLTQETLSLVLLSFRSLVITSSILYKSNYLLFHCLPLHAHHCSSWRQSFCTTVFFYFLPHFLWQGHFLFSSSLLYLWTLPLLVPFLPTLEASPSFFYYLLSSYISYITRFFSTSNLFPTTVFFFCFFPFLYFWVRCSNLLHCLHILLSFPSNSALSLARAHLSLSMLLIS